MIVFADRKVRRNTLDFLTEIRSLSGLDLLIAFGQFESGVVDALSPTEERYDARIRALRYAARTTARSWMGIGRPVLGPIHALDLPEEIEFVVPAGYACDALYPEMYAETARRFLREVAPTRTVVIGIRSIGTSLSAVVAAAVEAAMSVTLRPHGRACERTVKLSRDLAERLRWQRDAHFVIVDEGPFSSGSSFAAVVRSLTELGVPDDRIVLFPGRDTTGDDLGCPEARTLWPQQRRFTTAFEEVVLPLFGEPRDLSGGRWRELFWKDPTRFPAVVPGHERRKYLRDGTLLKFAGLGHIGRRKLARARLLAGAGFTPEVFGFDNGFLCTRWEEGAPLEPGMATLDLIERIADYLALIAREYEAAGVVRYDEIVQMVEANSGARLPKWDRPMIEDAPLVAIDGRMLPHEWIRTPSGFLKTDALDHSDDASFPGSQDIAWDLASAIVEFSIPREALVTRYLSRRKDRTLTRRLPFYMRAYLAYRLGYARLAAEALENGPDAERFQALGQRYSLILRQLLP